MAPVPLNTVLTLLAPLVEALEAPIVRSWTLFDRSIFCPTQVPNPSSLPERMRVERQATFRVSPRVPAESTTSSRELPIRPPETDTSTKTTTVRNVAQIPQGASTATLRNVLRNARRQRWFRVSTLAPAESPSKGCRNLYNVSSVLISLLVGWMRVVRQARFRASPRVPAKSTNGLLELRARPPETDTSSKSKNGSLGQVKHQEVFVRQKILWRGQEVHGGHA